ncbi:DUF4253 domain-containing protein [Glycomyces paridis]|uniref:DUF4253 domain-containing protein n=1 Tax=Glycomyces paridis TaxID=2126555 RepID=A0A4S8P9Q5_9ACTN|nr:DUF4253 domain-containing protein [Glycomyces paridis]THV27000.1 DUF4253 domain-containing protein [Glycomyces paridis]
MPDPAAQPSATPEPEPDSEPGPTSGALDDAAPETGPQPRADAPEEDSIASTTPAAAGLRLVPALDPEPEGESDAPRLVAVPDLDGDRPVPSEIFVPERPRRELLSLDKPEPPRRSGTGRDEMMPRMEADEALDIEGSPRADLRAAGLAVPKMHQLVRRGDTAMWAFAVRSSEALRWWLDIRQAADQTGWMPVLLGAPEEWRDNGEAIIHEGDDELARADEIDSAELLHDKAAEAGEPARGVPILPRRGDSDFATPQYEGLLGLVETDAGWKIPAMFPWKGSTNWELYGAEHAAVLRSWNRRFEAELVAMTYDVVELYVPRPPSAEEAIAVAGEAYAYCPDLLDSGVPTLEDLAEHMIRSRAWYFRWA